MSTYALLATLGAIGTLILATLLAALWFFAVLWAQRTDEAAQRKREAQDANETGGVS